MSGDHEAIIEEELAAVREQLPLKAPNRASRDERLDPTEKQNVVFDPKKGRISVFVDDPLFQAINFMWSDRQQHGRLTYEAMMKHPSINGGIKALLSFLRTYKPIVKPSAKNSTPKQKEIAEFAQAQLNRLGMSGDPRQGYDRLINGLYGSALEFGFSLGEIETEVATWRGKDMIQLKGIHQFPQASLDAGFMPLEEFGQLNLMNDPRYRCFDLNERGDITAIHQYRVSSNTESKVTWEGQDLHRVLHFIHNPREGSPYGESILYAAFYAWASLYTLEQLEEVFLDHGLPYLTATYKSKDGRTSPELHKEMVELVSMQDPSKRLLMGPDMQFGSASASNQNFTDHITQKKVELRTYINQAILMPQSLYTEVMDAESDTRNLVSVFFKYIAPAYLQELNGILNWQLLKRLIDANYSNLDDEDYPRITFSTILDNDLRVMQGILTQVLPFVHADKLGEMIHSFMPHFDPEFIPEDHKDSVEVKRPRGNPDEGQGESPPPPKEQGEDRVRQDGQTDNPSTSMGVEN